MSSLNRDTMMRVYPSVLDKDALFNALGRTTAEAIGKAFMQTDNVGIYSRIEELSEEVLDILARDFNIIWYDYDFQSDTKRRVIAAAFSVHRNIGTVGAMITAISAIWPNSTVEEWFEYGGDPFYFRAIVEANNPGDEPIRFDSIDKTVKLYKNRRSWLEDEMVILRISVGIVIKTSTNGQLYHTEICGTLPRRSTHGDDASTTIDIHTLGDFSKYHPLLTGLAEAGVNPAVSTHGDVSDGALNVGAAFGAEAYSSIPCGTPLGALM